MTLVALALIAFLAFATEGAIGFGSTLIIASIGAQLVPLDVLLPAFIPVSLALSAVLVARTYDAIAWRTLLVAIAPVVAIGTIGGLVLAHLPAQHILAGGLGAFVVVLAVLQLARPAAGALPVAWQRVMLLVGGIAHGLFGTGGPMIVYVAKRQLGDKRTFRATLAVLWFVLNLALVANYAVLGLYTRSVAGHLGVLAVMLPPGLVLGERLHHAMDPTKFERVVWTVLLLAGGALLVRSL